jgi:hypothetical protein
VITLAVAIGANSAIFCSISAALLEPLPYPDAERADSHMVGREISLGGERYTVVGVLAPEFRADPAAELWLPLQADPNSTGNAAYVRAVGRLRAG